MNDTSYEDAWGEGEQPDQPLENAVDLAKRRQTAAGIDEYERAHAEMERRESGDDTEDKIERGEDPDASSDDDAPADPPAEAQSRGGKRP